MRSAPSRSSMEATHQARSASSSRRNLSRMCARHLFAAARSFGPSAASAALSKASVASASLLTLNSVLPRPRSANASPGRRASTSRYSSSASEGLPTSCKTAASPTLANGLSPRRSTRP